MFNFGKLDYWGDSIPHRPSDLAYVKQVPLPAEDQPKSAKIRARCIEKMTILEHSIPTREETRKVNYDRRLDQINNQGFVSLKQEPYKAIGDPVYLDTKRLITDTLGLPFEGGDRYDIKPESPTPSDDQTNQKNSLYLIRKSKKQLNTLKKELDRGRGLLRNVKLGHGLFKILQDEWSKTVIKRESDAELAKQRAMMDWKMAKCGTDSESDSDDDEDLNDDIAKYFVQLDIPEQSQDEKSDNESPSREKDHVRFRLRPETHAGNFGDPSSKQESPKPVRQMSAPPQLRRRKGHAPRPYTPVHSNISQKKPQHTHIVGETLFRQLCCLHWILKTMDISDLSTMSPLITCWQLNADMMGGTELNKRQVEEKKQRDQLKYDNLFKVPKQKEIRRNRPRLEKKRPSYMTPRKLGPPVPRSRSGSIAQSQASNELPYTPMTDNYAATLDDPRFDIDNSTINEEKSLDSSQNAMTAHSLLPVESETMVNSRPPTRQPTIPDSRPSHIQLTKEEIQQQELAKHLEDIAKMDNMPMERLSHTRMYRATDAVKPQSSKELLEFKASCKSSLLVDRSKELKQSWAEVKEERALRLHDDLDYQEKNRLRTCQNKYSAMKTSSNSFHRALKDMRLRSDFLRKESEKEKNKKQDQSKYAKWFEDLISMIPADCTNQWYFTTIIDKLRIFGIKYGPDNKTESSSKASEHKFTRVLKLIRPWEICSPNIAAAVEFCRDRVIEMNEDDFEEVYQHIFPAIERPKTAPARRTK